MIPAGTPHIPRMAWANSPAATRSRITTDIRALIAPHSSWTAAV